MNLLDNWSRNELHISVLFLQATQEDVVSTAENDIAADQKASTDNPAPQNCLCLTTRPTALKGCVLALADTSTGSPLKSSLMLLE